MLSNTFKPLTFEVLLFLDLCEHDDDDKKQIIEMMSWTENETWGVTKFLLEKKTNFLHFENSM